MDEMIERGIDAEGFFASREIKYVKARRAMIDVLRGAGLNTYEIGRLVRRDESTVRYWIDGARRSRQAGRKPREKLWLRAIELGPICI
jgi:hypothetical protein